MLDRWETKALTEIDRAEMLTWRRTVQDRPTTANHAISVARTLWRWAISEGMAEANSAQRLEPLETSPEQAPPWPDWALDAMKAARWELRLFTMLGHYTGQRTRDIVKMTLHDLTPDGIGVIPSRQGSRC